MTRTLPSFNRLASCIAGLFLFAFGIHLYIKANIGLSPWAAFTMGLSYATGISFGLVSLVVGLLILILTHYMKEPFGIGTVLNILIIGNMVDFFLYLNLIPMQTDFFYGVLTMLTGQICVCFASYLYIKPALGCGPRDSLMIALAKRFPNVPIGIIRALLEGTVLFTGWLLGAKVGMGTLLFVLSIGFLLQTVFTILHFDVANIKHDRLL